jgi:hypothetical protein
VRLGNVLFASALDRLKGWRLLAHYIFRVMSWIF